MAVKLTVFFLIATFLLSGCLLILLPWLHLTSDWGDNYFLVSASTALGLPMLRQIVASNWARGAVSALGVINLVVAFWEIANFNREVSALNNENQSPNRR